MCWLVRRGRINRYDHHLHSHFDLSLPAFHRSGIQTSTFEAKNHQYSFIASSIAPIDPICVVAAITSALGVVNVHAGIPHSPSLARKSRKSSRFARRQNRKGIKNIKMVYRTHFIIANPVSSPENRNPSYEDADSIHSKRFVCWKNARSVAHEARIATTGRGIMPAEQK